MKARIVSTAVLTLLASGTAWVASSGDPVRLSGAGATFPAPVYSKWFEEYHKLHPDVEIAYEAVGSGGGIRKLLDASVDFAGSDGPMTDEQLAEAKGKIVHLPTVIGAVVVISNVNGITGALRFTPEALARIYLGKISRWNDPQIAAENPGVLTLPSEDIIVVHRSEGSGTTYIWTDYLSHVSDDWKQKVGRGLSISWPVGLAAKGNEGVAKLVKETPGSIGYIELAYATENGLEHNAIKNRSGQYVKATLASLTAAAASTNELPEDFRMSIVNAAGNEAYPISSFTWLLVPSPIADDSKRRALTDVLRWAISDGQNLASRLSFAPLPKPVVDRESQAIARLAAETHQ
jgi:phosphate transport system substrate-binding protein